MSSDRSFRSRVEVWLYKFRVIQGGDDGRRKAAEREQRMREDEAMLEAPGG